MTKVMVYNEWHERVADYSQPVARGRYKRSVGTGIVHVQRFAGDAVGMLLRRNDVL